MKPTSSRREGPGRLGEGEALEEAATVATWKPSLLGKNGSKLLCFEGIYLKVLDVWKKSLNTFCLLVFVPESGRCFFCLFGVSEGEGWNKKICLYVFCVAYWISFC